MAQGKKKQFSLSWIQQGGIARVSRASNFFRSLLIPSRLLSYFQQRYRKYLLVNGDRYRELKDAVLFPTTMVNSEAAREGREKEQRCNYIAGSEG